MSTKDEQEILTLNHYLQLKSEGYEFEGQSYLFWEYMRLLNEVKPTYFLLENVMMGEKWEKILSKAIGVNPIEINSSLLSAQNRRRLYWTNIGMQPSGLFGDMESIIKQPKDLGILLKDILQDNPNAKYYVSNKFIDKINRSNNAEKCLTINDKSMCLAAGYYKQGRDNQYIPVDEKYFLSEKSLKSMQLWNAQQNPLDGIETNYRKNGCLTARGNEDLHSGIKLVVHNTMPRSSTTGKGGTGPLSREDGKTYCLDTGNTNAIEIRGGDFRYDEGFRWRDGGKSGTLCTNSESFANINSKIRRLTPIECERLQTVADNYTNHVSDSQRYKMLGNGWTVDVIAHIFGYIK